jgi:hypothetical protein
MIPPPFFSKPDVLSLKNVNKIVPQLEQGGILIVVVIGLVTLARKLSMASFASLIMTFLSLYLFIPYEAYKGIKFVHKDPLFCI